MRRAAQLAFSTARRSSLSFRKFLTSSRPFPSPFAEAKDHVVDLRPGSFAIRRYSSSTLHSSMRLPKFPLAFISTLGAIGAWYAYRGDGAEHLLHKAEPAVSSPSTRALSTKSHIAEPTEPPGDPASVSVDHEPARKALVVDNDQFFTGSIVGEGPLAKDTDDYGRKVLEMMTPEQATERLRKNEESYLVGRGRGVVRYDLVQLASNDPNEDDHAEKIVEIPNTVAATDGAPSSDWMFWGVFDGHSGWTTSAKLRQVLISFAARELNQTYRAALSNASSPFPTPASIDAAIKTAFVKLDNEICLDSVNKLDKNPSKRLAAEILAPALSGACALLSFYDSQSKTLRVACTGDSRAVLGRRNPQTGKWFATPLSEDQTGSNPNEEARMRAEHPEEPFVIRAGRVLGQLEPTRAFGDAFYKWSREVQDRVKKHFFGRTPHQWLKTPPYVTAEPVVTSTVIDPGQGDFVVMATDGLWEMLTNEEVVGLMGQWMESQKQASSSTSSSTQWLKSLFQSGSSQSLPVEKGGNMDKTGRVSDENVGVLPVRQQQWSLQGGNKDGRFVVEDKNAATHLVRNALGGRDRDMVCALLTLPSPYSRRYRDDLTVEVIFFGDGRETGAVVVNTEATAGGGSTNGPVKAKL